MNTTIGWPSMRGLRCNEALQPGLHAAWGVARVAPCHCTGALAGAARAATFGGTCIRCGAGRVMRRET